MSSAYTLPSLLDDLSTVETRHDSSEDNADLPDHSHEEVCKHFKQVLNITCYTYCINTVMSLYGNYNKKFNKNFNAEQSLEFKLDVRILIIFWDDKTQF